MTHFNRNQFKVNDKVFVLGNAHDDFMGNGWVVEVCGSKEYAVQIGSDSDKLDWKKVFYVNECRLTRPFHG